VLYFWVKQVHVWSVMLSFSLFLLRGAWLAAGGKPPRSVVLRSLPHAIDTVLLTSALWLTTIIQQFPFQHPWLTTKVLLLCVYIALGHVALRRARTRLARSLAFAAAVAVFLFIYSVARLHHPMGALLLAAG
jgi:uncharacterized membrane protein SirB2